MSLGKKNTDSFENDFFAFDNGAEGETDIRDKAPSAAVIPVKKLVSPIIWGVLLALFGVGWYKLAGLSDAYRVIAQRAINTLAAVCARLPLPIPLAELTWIALPSCFLLGLIYMVLKYRLRGLLRFLARYVWFAGAVFLWFVVIFGVQYTAPPLTEDPNLSHKEYTVEELTEVTALLAEKLNEYSLLLDRNPDGTMAEADYARTCELVADSYEEGYFAKSYLAGPRVMPRQAVLFSRQMSYINLAGYFFPYGGESIVSADQTPPCVPFTAAHEVAHTFGIAPEDEANFAAFVCCIQSEEPVLCYSGYFNAYIYASNALYEADREKWNEIYGTLEARVIADLLELSRHLAQYEGNLNDLGTAINDGYIQATGQSEGIISYSLVVKLIISYYITM